VPVMSETHVKVDAGEVIFSEGDKGDSLFVVSEGLVQIQKNTASGPLVLTRLGPGEFLGEMAVINGSPRSATAVAVEPSTLLVYPAQEIELLISEHPSVGARIIQLLAERLRKTNEMLKVQIERNRRDN